MIFSDGGRICLRHQRRPGGRGIWAARGFAAAKAVWCFRVDRKICEKSSQKNRGGCLTEFLGALELAY